MNIMTPVLKTSRRLLLCNIVRNTFLNKAVSVEISGRIQKRVKVIILTKFIEMKKVI